MSDCRSAAHGRSSQRRSTFYGESARRSGLAWFSNHLSFSAFAGSDNQRDDKWTHAGFLLPRFQSLGTAAVAANKARDLSASLDLPVAFETGVNYLRKLSGELEDGAFCARVFEILDAHVSRVGL